MTKIGRYEILGELGRGGMGIVYKAFDPVFDRELAIKIMLEEICSQPEFRRRFSEEARSLGKLNHMNIITVYDAGEENGRPYLVMEFLEGRDLREEIERPQCKTLEERLVIMRAICRALAHAHGKNVIHRDIKPSNIYLTNSGEVKILDFGLARTLAAITKSTRVMGTANYMSPEQYEREADHRSDIFSSGAVFYELLTYRMAFPGDAPVAMQKIFNENPEPVASKDPRIPSRLSVVIMKALAKNPHDRFQDIEDIARELELVQSSLESQLRSLQAEARDAVGNLVQLVEGNTPILQDDGFRAIRDLYEFPSNPDPEDLRASAPADLPQDYLGLIDLINRAASCSDNLRGLLETRKLLAPLFEQAEAMIENGQEDEAVRILDRILDRDPGYPGAVRLHDELVNRIEEKRKMEENARRASELLYRASGQYASGDLLGALASLDAVYELEASSSEAASLRALVENGIREQQEQADKCRRAREALARAKAALENNEFESAREFARNAGLLEPGEKQAGAILQEIHRSEAAFLQRKERERRILVLLEEARSHVRLGEQDQALEQIRNILMMDPSHEAALALEEAIEKKKQIRERAREHYENARLSLASDDLQSSILALEAALHLEHDYAEAATLKEYVLKELKNREALDRGGQRLWMRLKSTASRPLARWILSICCLVALGLVLRQRYMSEPAGENNYDQAVRGELEKGNYQEAVSVLQSWLSRDINNAAALELQAEVYALIGHLSNFNRAVEDKDYLTARRALLALESSNKTDPNMTDRWETLRVVFSPDFQDEFLGGLEFWNAPQQWEVDRGRLMVRGPEPGFLTGKYYGDFTSTFNISFVNQKGAVWLLRAAEDLSSYYLFQLTGPEGKPPNSFAAFKQLDGRKAVVLQPIMVGVHLGRKGDQFNITVKAEGNTIEHWIEVVSAPARDPRPLALIRDASVAGGTLGFGTIDGEEFIVRAFKVLPSSK